MSNGAGSTRRVFFVRKGSGGAYVEPPRVIVPQGGRLEFRNYTACPAHVSVAPGGTKPQEFDVPEDGRVVGVDVGGSGYYEYRVKLICKGLSERFAVQYAEGESDPGIIVD
jgi:hypothetical protein